MEAAQFTPAGYLAKRAASPKDYERFPGVSDVCSVSGDAHKNFDDDYIYEWKHNGYWFFDSPEKIREVALDAEVSLDGTRLFYYEVYPLQFDPLDERRWVSFAPEAGLPTNVCVPAQRQLFGFDVVTFPPESSPGCSPLWCNNLAKEIAVNSHCLIDTFEDTKSSLERGLFTNAEPGPYRIFAVYLVPWDA